MRQCGPHTARAGFSLPGKAGFSLPGRAGFSLPGRAGFSLIEIIVVLALIGFIYTVAIPNFNQRTGAETSTKLSELAGDFRNAFDLSVLTGKTYRLVFMMGSGDYWLEEADRTDVFLGVD